MAFLLHTFPDVDNIGYDDRCCYLRFWDQFSGADQMRRVPDLNKEQTLGLWHDMLEHGDGHHEGEEEGEEVEDGVELEGALQLHRLQLHLGCCGSA